MKKKLLAAAIAALAVLSTLIAAWLFMPAKLRAKCPKYHNELDGLPWYVFGPGLDDVPWLIDCRGIVAIEGWRDIWSDTKYRVTDIDRNIDYGGFNGKGYRFDDRSLYFVNDSNVFPCSENKDSKCILVRPNTVKYSEEKVELGWTAETVISRFRKIDYNTGESVGYDSYDQMPEPDRAVFKELKSV